MKKSRVRLLLFASGAICAAVLGVGAVRYREFGGLYYRHELQSNPDLLFTYLAAPADTCRARGAELYLRSAAGRRLVRRILMAEVLPSLCFRDSIPKSTAALVALSGNRLRFRIRSEDGVHGGGIRSVGRGCDRGLIPVLSPRLCFLCGLVYRFDDPCVSVRVLSFGDALRRFDEDASSPFSLWSGSFCLYIERT